MPRQKTSGPAQTPPSFDPPRVCGLTDREIAQVASWCGEAGPRFGVMMDRDERGDVFVALTTPRSVRFENGEQAPAWIIARPYRAVSVWDPISGEEVAEEATMTGALRVLAKAEGFGG